MVIDIAINSNSIVYRYLMTHNQITGNGAPFDWPWFSWLWNWDRYKITDPGFFSYHKFMSPRPTTDYKGLLWYTCAVPKLASNP